MYEKTVYYLYVYTFRTYPPQPHHNANQDDVGLGDETSAVGVNYVIRNCCLAHQAAITSLSGTGAGGAVWLCGCLG